ncbi:MAG: hypothetical protein SWH68_15885 [Thermodesulfobacteriota bacterium]|nr:hypothetical protein [Thermodesulfobacteriota bacterium]
MTLLKKFQKYLAKKNTGDEIIQFSPPRSGSTLVYNILRDIFPEKTIRKTHQYAPDFSRHRIVVTYRHPLDCIASSLQRYGKPPSDIEINTQIKEFDENGIWDLLSLNKGSRPNVLLLRYEIFYNNFEYIFNNFEDFFSICIPVEQRQTISKKYNINTVYQSIQKYSDFNEFDEDRHWHGNHISKYKGKTYYYKQFFNRQQIAHLKNVYHDILMSFGYDE